MEPDELMRELGSIGTRLRLIEAEAWSDFDVEAKYKDEIALLVDKLSALIVEARNLPVGCELHDRVCAFALIAANNYFTKDLSPGATSALSLIRGHGLDALALTAAWLPDGMKFRSFKRMVS